MPREKATRTAESPKPTIAVVQHVAVGRRGLLSVLNETGLYTVLGFASGAELLERCKKGLAPDVAFVELDLPEMDGYMVLAWLRDHARGVRAIAMAYRPDEPSIRKAIRLDAASVVCTTMREDDLLKAPRDVLQTGNHQNVLLKRLLVAPQNTGVATRPDRFAALSEQELRYVKEQCASGCPNLAAIAGRMKITLNTAKTYRRRAMAKLKVKGVAALVQLALVQGLLRVGKG